MAAQYERLLQLAHERDPAISGRIVMVLHRQILDLGLEPLARLEPGIGPCEALRAVFVAGERAQFLQVGDGSLGVDRNVGHRAYQSILAGGSSSKCSRSNSDGSSEATPVIDSNDRKARTS